MIEIPLSRGQMTLIDDEDADLCQFKWNASFHPHYADGGRYVARRTIVGNHGRKTTEYLHRTILERVLGRELLPGEKVDHISGDTLDNRRSQIRLATGSQNQMNKPLQANNTSGFKGVHRAKRTGKWQAYITKDGKRRHLGTYETPEEAHAAYCAAAIELHGEFARAE